MAQKGKLILDLVDSRERRITEPVDIELQHRTLSQRKVAKQINMSRKKSIGGLHRQPKGQYRLFIEAPSYLPVHRFVNIPAGGDRTLTLPLAVNPRKIRKIVFPAFATLEAVVQQILIKSDSPLSFEGKKGSPLYSALDDSRKAGFLNIVAKSADTVLPNSRRVLDYIRRVTELRGDRFFAVVDHELREEVKNATATGLFEEADSSLHHPPDGFAHAGSFKTDDQYGNLQITFFAEEGGQEWRADIDIDDAKGIGHIFQVARNFLTGGTTNPLVIHEVLLVHQSVDPGYDFVL